ncbi:ABC-type metal ion transport system [Tumidithrix helvetica PCC 7403]|uniref:NIL domain-containing protein n=1 Tax=Tumidithrix helvetica TaxID=3457545 RepID=UPI003C9613A8
MTQNSHNSKSTASLGAHPNRQEDPRLMHVRIWLRIPKLYQQEPVISKLVSHHGLIVNINSAMLSAETQLEGWFNLELRGTAQQINSALTFANELGVETVPDYDDREEGW